MIKKNNKYVCEHAKKNLKGVSINLAEDNDKYTLNRAIQIYRNYDLLENLLVTRSYIQKRYSIDWQGLELLLKLMGMRIFTIKDYTELPKDFSYTRFRNALERGWIQLIQDHNSAQYRVYGLSTKAKNIVVRFYKTLFGEEKIPEDGRINPMAKKSAQIAFDKKKMDLVKKLNKLPNKLHFKKLYE